MKILLIGATGLIGKAVAERLSNNHEIIRVGYRNGDYKVDLGSKNSIELLFKNIRKNIGKIDAVVCTAGDAEFAPFNELSDEAYTLALSNKLMGQINLVRVGQHYVNDGASFTLTAGILSREPMPGSITISIANGALESFSKAAALEMKRGLRINTVSPIFIKETMEMMGMDSTLGLSATDSAKAYEVAVEGDKNGSVLDTPDYV